MTETRDDSPSGERLRGRRGGRTTMTPLLVRKTYWIDREVEQILREDAFRTGKSEAEIVRLALRRHYEIED